MYERIERYGDKIFIERTSDTVDLKPIKLSKRMSKLIIKYGELMFNAGSKARYLEIQSALGIQYRI